MGTFPARTVDCEVEKLFHGSAEAGALTALRLGEQMLDLFVAAHPGTTREQARATLGRNKNRGRRPSRTAQT